MSPEARTHQRSPSGRSGLVPILACVVAFGALTFGWWRLGLQMTGQPRRPASDHGATLWIRDGVIPFTVEGTLDDAYVAVVGDSRTWYGIDHDVLADAGLGPSASVWYGGADLRVLLREARSLDVERLVVALSPLSLAPEPNPMALEVARSRAPVFDPENAGRAEVAAWARSELEHLVDREFREDYARTYLDTLRDHHRREREDAVGSTRSIDRHLGVALDRFRAPWLETIETVRWQRSWMHVPEPGASNAVYWSKLRPKYAPLRAEGAREVTELLRDLSSDMEIVCVRMPISAELRAVEDERVDPELLVSVARDAGVPFRDFGTAYPTGDGSHLLVRGAAEFSRDLAVWLKESQGW